MNKLIFLCSVALFSYGFNSSPLIGSQWKVNNAVHSRDTAFSGNDFLCLLSDKGELLITHDGGANWLRVAGSVIQNFRCISFIDDLRGWAADSGGQIWTSSDGGKFWTKLSSIHGLTDSSVGVIQQILFIDALHGWLLNEASLWRTKDGGFTWHQYTPSKNQMADSWLAECYFQTSQIGWVSTNDSSIFLTKDGGQTWVRRQLFYDRRIVFGSFHFINLLTGCATGELEDSLFCTADGGNEWHQRIISIPGKQVSVNSVSLFDNKIVWASGILLKPREGLIDKAVILRSTDDGANWSIVDTLPNEPFWGKLHFSDKYHGWTFSLDRVYRTDDGGMNWRVVLDSSKTSSEKITQ